MFSRRFVFGCFLLFICAGLGHFACGPALQDEKNAEVLPTEVQKGDAGISEDKPIPDTKQPNPEQPIQDGGCRAGATRPCYTGAADTKGKGECKTGVEVCKDGIWGSCSGDILPTKKDDCDGRDNDCDGQIDEDCKCQNDDKQSCYPHPIGCKKVGEHFRCEAPCKSGEQVCTNNKWDSCKDAVGPAKEVCDGKDNDCDGKIDNDLKAPSCTKKDGVCKGTVQTCEGAKGWSACSVTNYGKEYETKETKCDGKDNDCDGKIDNDLKAPPCTKKDGVCKGTVQKCGGSKGWIACVESDYGKEYEAKETKCDGKDNNCDGQVDNISNPPLCAKQGGVCKGATKQKCAGAAGWTACSSADYKKHNASYEMKETSCDGLDNDCNNVIDDTVGPLCSKQIGVCKGKVKFCYANKYQACDHDPQGGTKYQYGKDFQLKETRCDKMDNDCDGLIDVLCTSTFAGQAGSSGTTNHASDPTKARFESPEAVALYNDVLYTADVFINSQIRKINLKTGKVETMSPRFKRPKGLTTDNKGNLYVADTANHVIKKIPLINGTVSNTYGALGTSGAADGTATARFNAPQGLAFDSNDGSLYVADTKNHTIRKIDNTGKVTTFAGKAGSSGTADHATDPKQARFKFPESLAIYKGILYIADSQNNVIRKITLLSGKVETMTPSFDFPRGITVDNSGNLYISDTNKNTIKKMIPSGTVTIIAGQTSSGKLDDWSTKASFNAPQGLVLDPAGNFLYVADTDSHTIRKIKLK